MVINDASIHEADKVTPDSYDAYLGMEISLRHGVDSSLYQTESRAAPLTVTTSLLIKPIIIHFWIQDDMKLNMLIGIQKLWQPI